MRRSFKLDFVNFKNTTEALLKVARKCEDMKPLMKNIAGIMADAVEENFEQEGRPDKWQELAESTIKHRKNTKHWPGRILQVEGQLATSVTTQYDNESAIIGSNLEYAAIHQLGGQAGKGKKVTIPARPYLKIDDSDNKKMLEEIKNYLNSQKLS
ncbi:MAG: phage virion morphogenesis protein [Candidatus Gastranaerophilales bacterium]|nr:phage virion morphogenesis protein [Candidatus Gastranaerophilales bacterium]